MLLRPSLRMLRSLSSNSSSRRSRLVSHKPRRRLSSRSCLPNTRRILVQLVLPLMMLQPRVRRPRRRALSSRISRTLSRILRRSRPKKLVLLRKLDLRLLPSSTSQKKKSQIPFPTQNQNLIFLNSRLTSLRSSRKKKRRRLKLRPERLPSRPSHQTQLSPLLRPLRRSTRKQ